MVFGDHTFVSAARCCLDVIVPTYERPRSLRRALDTLLAAPVPAELTAHVIVVDNDGTDKTFEVIRDASERFPGRVMYVRERRRGKSYALNTALSLTRADLIGLVDDDEEIDSGWYQAIADAFADDAVDFIGGRCLPRWGAVPPSWMPERWRGVIGFVDDGDSELVFGKDAPGMLMGGNAVIRRRVLDRVGAYSTALGPSPDRRLLSGEDQDLYARLIEAGAHGLYVPALTIYHFVPPQRLTKRYYRRWTFWNGVATGVIGRLTPQDVPHVGRVPRHLFGSAVRGLVSAAAPGREADERFSGELALWHLAGVLYGSYWCRQPELARSS